MARAPVIQCACEPLNLNIIKSNMVREPNKQNIDSAPTKSNMVRKPNKQNIDSTPTQCLSSLQITTLLKHTTFASLTPTPNQTRQTPNQNNNVLPASSSMARAPVIQCACEPLNLNITKSNMVREPNKQNIDSTPTKSNMVRKPNKQNIDSTPTQCLSSLQIITSIKHTTSASPTPKQTP
jgi:hypothetical protein